MSHSQPYVLGQSERAARRLAIQDAHFGEVSERLLDELKVQPHDRIVEIGCGPGGLSKRILQRLGKDGVLVGVDRSEGLLDQAKTALAGIGQGRFEPVLADVAELGSWLEGANVVVGRTVLHHVPMAEIMVGRLRAALKPGTRVGFLEPDFRSTLGRLAYLEANGRPELAPLRVWATVINTLYQMNGLTPDIGATLTHTFETAGFRNVRTEWLEGRPDAPMIENILMFYDEVSDRLQSLGILTADGIAEQQRLLKALPSGPLPAAWATYRVTGEA